MIKSKPFYKALCAVSILLYLFVPVKLVQIISLTFLLIFLLSFVYAKIISQKLKVQRNLEVLHLACKEKAELSFSLINYSSLPLFTCFVYDDVSFLYVYQEKNRELCYLRPKEIKKFEYTIMATERGEFSAGPVNIKASDPLNLFEIELEIEVKTKILVRPARIILDTIPFPGLPQGGLSIKNIIYEDVTMRRSLREYENGDELKRINWRASAKYGTLYTNEYQNTYDVPFFVFINLGEEDYRLDQRKYKIERALEIGAAIVEKAVILKQRVGFAAYAQDFPFLKPMENQGNCILDMFATIKPFAGKLDYDPVLKFKNQLPQGTLFFVIGPAEVDFYDDKFMAQKTDMSTENLKIRIER
ncbi:MAG: DUF58 domain-containing protein [Treponema sp.]|nr:DUF58 domain-containing protein [Treponema sp.]